MSGPGPDRPRHPAHHDEVLDYEKVRENYNKVLAYAAELYADTVNIIHYMHDKYAYEASQMAPSRYMGGAPGSFRRFRPFRGCGLFIGH